MAILDEDDHWTWQVPGARAVFTSRETGDVTTPDGFAAAATLIGLDPARIARVSQVHGADVWLDLARSDSLPDVAAIEADGLVTTRTGVALSVRVADCMPIAVAWGDAIAAIHAGWRSLEGGVIEATLSVLRRAIGAAVALDGVRPHAVIGPALCPECFEVGEEVAARFDPAIIIRRDGAPRPFLDARADAVRRLEDAGCLVEHVDLCTSCDPRLFSHRGDGGTTGRQSVLVRRA